MKRTQFKNRVAIGIAGLLLLPLTLFIGTQLIRRMNESATRSTLTVLTYGSFIGPFGPGPQLKTLFEATCHCLLEFVNTGNGGLLVQRLKMMPEQPVDVVVGLDQLTLAGAKKDLLWLPLENLEVKWEMHLRAAVHAAFVPIDWAPMTILYRQGEIQPVSSWQELLQKNKNKKISLQDPRTSTPGLQFLYWIKAISGTEGIRNFFNQLRPFVHSFSPSWSSAYGLFQSGATAMTFTYLTSLVYHWRDEGDYRYQAMQFMEGHPVQVEYVTISRRCQNCLLAQDFVSFLLTREAQKIIMEKNYMFPSVQGVREKSFYDQLPALKTLPIVEPSVKEQTQLIQLWKELFR